MIFLSRQKCKKRTQQYSILNNDNNPQSFSKDTTHVFVTVGLGIQAQFTLDEALEFIEKKVADLQAFVLLINLLNIFDISIYISILI